jgi:hypothetical protein
MATWLAGLLTRLVKHGPLETTQQCLAGPAGLETDRDEHRRGGRDPDAAMSTLLVRNSDTQRGTTGARIENVLDHDLNEKGGDAGCSIKYPARWCNTML